MKAGPASSETPRDRSGRASTVPAATVWHNGCGGRSRRRPAIPPGLPGAGACRPAPRVVDWTDPLRARNFAPRPFPLPWRPPVMSLTARLLKGAGPLALGGLLLTGAAVVADEPPSLPTQLV